MKFNKVYPDRSRRAFSLVELMVVIAIIGILASMILLTTSVVKKKAKDAQVKSNVDQLQNVMKVYYADHRSYGAIQDDPNFILLSAELNNSVNQTHGYLSYGVIWKINDDPKSYAIFAYLNASNKVWCLDYVGVAKEVSTIQDCHYTTESIITK